MAKKSTKSKKATSKNNDPFVVDMSNVAVFRTLDAGKYQFEVEKVEFGTNASKKPQVTVYFKGLGLAKGASARKFFQVEEKSLFKLKEFLEACGFDCSGKSVNIKTLAEKSVGKVLVVAIEPEEYNGNTYNTPTNFFDKSFPTGLAEVASDDDFEDDDAEDEDTEEYDEDEDDEDEDEEDELDDLEDEDEDEDEEEEDDEEDDEEDEEDEDEDEEEEYEDYTEAELKKMSVSELEEICEDWDLEPVASKKTGKTIKSKTIALILEAQDEEDED